MGAACGTGGLTGLRKGRVLYAAVYCGPAEARFSSPYDHDPGPDEFEGAPEPVIIPRADHSISRANISPSALKVLYRLKDAGYQGFLVGGAVRDLLLGLQPKDFDIATDAHPEEVRKIFRNCRLIGRRFHLAHVRFGQEIIEVATFRFTANALYYSIEDFSIWDYVGGAPDARDRVLRMIGDPETRYREDPVRMLRAARFAAKLGFTLHPGTEAPLHKLAYMLDAMPPARLFDETLKLLLGGHAFDSFETLMRLGLAQHLFPDVAATVRKHLKSPPVRLLELGLAGTDQRVRAEMSVTPTFLFAVLLWPAILAAAGAPEGPMPSDPQVLLAAIDDVVGRQLRRVSIPKRFSLPMRDIIMLQPRFERRSGRRALRLLEHPKFRAAYDFLLLRAASGEIDPEIAAWWTHLQELPADARIAEVESQPRPEGEPAAAGAPRRRRRRPRRSGPATPAE